MALKPKPKPLSAHILRHSFHSILEMSSRTREQQNERSRHRFVMIGRGIEKAYRRPAIVKFANGSHEGLQDQDSRSPTSAILSDLAKACRHQGSQDAGPSLRRASNICSDFENHRYLCVHVARMGQTTTCSQRLDSLEHEA
jgi:hypothetical protein